MCTYDSLPPILESFIRMSAAIHASIIYLGAFPDEVVYVCNIMQGSLDLQSPSSGDLSIHQISFLPDMQVLSSSSQP